MEDKIIGLIRECGITELSNVTELNELPGTYVNVESVLLDGTTGKALDDNKNYLCTQVEKGNGSCYGVAADENKIVIFEYEEDGKNSKVVKIINV